MTLSLSKDGTNVQKEAWVCGTESFGKLTGCFIADYTFASEPVISNPKFVSHPSALCHGGTGTFFLLDLYASKHESVDLQGSRYLLWCGLLLTGSALGALHCRRTEASGEHCCMQELSKAITCLINVYVCYFTISIMDGCCPAERGRYSLRKGLFFSTLRLAWHVRAYTASESFPTSIRVRTWR